MIVKNIEEMENILFPYAKNRYNIANAGFGGKLLKGLVGGRMNSLSHQIVQAFCRTIFSIQTEMFLRDITAAVLSETSHVIGFKPYSVSGEMTLNSDLYFQTMGELHNWFVMLAENGFLPGRYERFIGKFSKA